MREGRKPLFFLPLIIPTYFTRAPHLTNLKLCAIINHKGEGGRGRKGRTRKILIYL